MDEIKTLIEQLLGRIRDELEIAKGDGRGPATFNTLNNVAGELVEALAHIEKRRANAILYDAPQVKL